MGDHDKTATGKPVNRGASTALFLGMVAIVSSVVVVGGLIGIAAVWMGNRALRGIYESEGRDPGRGMARGGVVLGWMALAISIVALIGWVFVPKVHESRDVAAETKTLSRMHGIMEGCAAYAADHEDHLPPHLAAAMTGYGVTPEMLIDPRAERLPMKLPEGAVEGRVDWHTFARDVDTHCDFVLTGAGLKIPGDNPRVLMLVAKRKALGKWLVGKIGGEVDFIDDPEFRKLLEQTNEIRAEHHLEPVTVTEVR